MGKYVVFCLLIALTGCSDSTQANIIGNSNRDCRSYFDTEQILRFKNSPVKNRSEHLMGVSYSQKLKTCVSKWRLSYKNGADEYWYYDLKADKLTRIVLSPIVDKEKLPQAAEEYEKQIGFE